MISIHPYCIPLPLMISITPSWSPSSSHGLYCHVLVSIIPSWSLLSPPALHICHCLWVTIKTSRFPLSPPDPHYRLPVLITSSLFLSPPPDPCCHLLVPIISPLPTSSPLGLHHPLLVPTGPQYLLLIPINVPIVSSLSSLSCPIPHPSMPSPTGAGLPGQWCFPGSLSVPSQAVPGQGASTSSPQPVGLGWLEPWGCS